MTLVSTMKKLIQFVLCGRTKASSKMAYEKFINAFVAAIPEPFLILDENGYYVDIIGGIDRNRYHDSQHLIGKRMHDVMDAQLAEQYLEQVHKAIESEQILEYVYQLSAKDIKGSETLPGPEGQLWFEAHISPIKKIEGKPRMVAWLASNITELKNTILEKDSLINQLQEATNEIKTLKGILPICSYCKNIKDDKGDWKKLEAYINDHSDADLSHGICPDCAKKHYPEYCAIEDEVDFWGSFKNNCV